jgi:hypothetical protein
MRSLAFLFPLTFSAVDAFSDVTGASTCLLEAATAAISMDKGSTWKRARSEGVVRETFVAARKTSPTESLESL